MFASGYLIGSMHDAHTDPSVLDQAEHAIEARADTEVSQATLTSAAVRAMLATLGDRWATYYPPGSASSAPDALVQLTTGRYGGIGVWLSQADDGVLISGVQPASPAARAGLRPGDQIRAVDARLASALGLSGVVASLQGPAGSSVRLVIARAGLVQGLTVRRAVLSAGNVTVEQVAPGILRIAISSFSRGVGAEVATIVRDAVRHHVAGFVLDLRGDPGGLLSEGLAVASVFLDGGPVVSLSGRHVPAEVLDAARGGNTTTPLAVLVNGGTASAAEVVAGALQDRGRAVLVGSRTFGKGTVQQPIRLSNGAVIEVTVAQYLTPDGQVLTGAGLNPDIEVPEGDAPSVAVTEAVRVLVGLEQSAPLSAADVSGR